MSSIKNILMLSAMILLAGCASTKPLVLVETEMYYLIPANEAFRAVVTDGGPVEDVIRSYDSYVVDAAKLIKLQEQANSCTINN